MRALTVLQPWASLIAVGAKTIETRSWSTNYRGPLAIHAGKKLIVGEDIPCEIREAVRQHPEWHGSLNSLALHGAGVGTWSSLAAQPHGVIVATCRLVNCVQIGIFPERICTICRGYLKDCNHKNTHTEQGVPPIKGIEAEYLFGDYTPGRYAWILTDIKALPSPIVCRGAQGLWNVPDEIAKKLEATNAE